MSSDPVTLIKELSALSQQPEFASDPQAQENALHLSKRLSVSLQKPADAAIELSFYPAFTLAARIAIDLKLFNILSHATTPKTSAELAEISGGDERLIVRLLRPLAALGFVEEIDEKTWIATPITHVMMAPPIQAAHIHFWDQGNNTMAKMPSFFKGNGYSQPEDPTRGALQHAFGTDKEAFDYWHQFPVILDNFNTFMTGNRGSRPSWVEWWPVEENIFKDTKLDDDSPILVDIAGGRGHDVQAFKNKFSDKGRLVVEDLPVVIDDIKELDAEIERVKYDFFTPQPIHGAKIYFFHFILHDWSDEVCLKILKNTTGAMRSGYSKLILNEFILPNQGCPLFPAGFDLQMMAMHAGQERTENQWKDLLGKAGLKIIQFSIPANGGEGIIETELA